MLLILNPFLNTHWVSTVRMIRECRYPTCPGLSFSVALINSSLCLFQVGVTNKLIEALDQLRRHRAGVARLATFAQDPPRDVVDLVKWSAETGVGSECGSELYKPTV